MARRAALTCMSLNLASAPGLVFAWSYKWMAIDERQDAFLLCYPVFFRFFLIRTALHVLCGSHIGRAPLEPGLQGRVLGSALQTAFQLGNASTRWLGIFAVTSPAGIYIQDPVRLLD
jgi:hypothetical protein